MTGQRERTAALIDALSATYPDAHCELDYRSPFELLVATILSAQCTDKRVNMVTPALFAAFPQPADLAKASQIEIEAIIRSTGFFRSKAKNIIACAKAIMDNHNGSIPTTIQELAALPGVGRKTANVVLGNAFGIQAGIVVDTHVRRLAQRLRLTKHNDPVKIERDLVRVIPKSCWTQFSHWLIWHGRRRCTARSPQCLSCEIATLCPSARKLSATTTRASDSSTRKGTRKPSYSSESDTSSISRRTAVSTTAGKP